MPESPEQPAPDFDPRPPEQRKSARGEDESDSSRRKRRQSRSDLNTSPARRGSLMGRLSGRSELERAKIKRYDPYSYESNSTQLKWLVIVLVLWTVTALALAWQDRATAALLVDLRDHGIVSVPPTQFSGPGILDFAIREGIACNSESDITALTPECIRLLDAQADYAGTKDTGSIFFVLLMAVFLANMFAFGSFTHRASRNLLTLKSNDQGFTPEKGVVWFFVPVFNLFKPWQVYRELFRGSDPAVTTDDALAWKTKGKVPAIVNVWAGIFVVVFFFNSLTVGRVWYSVRETVDDVIVAHQRLIIADFLLVVLGIAAIIVVIELHRRQEARHVLIGDITITPPRPVDPLEKALKEGIRRKELENRRSRRRDRDETKGS